MRSIDDLDEPFPGEDADTPPIPGKVNPSHELSDAVPTLDDEARHYRHHPNESGVVDFDVDPYAGDAAADLAGDLGSEFLEGATRGQDMSDVMMSRDDQEGDAPFLYEEEMLNVSDEQEDEEERAEFGEDEAEPESVPSVPPASERQAKRQSPTAAPAPAPTPAQTL
ncbi:MAG TPA: hypothetical protein VLS89_06680, partial [Candidatus Nanopelagicales bacterium]|nr:hypothetical protein [Candidatus Nanopelagicales bacterium]